MPGVDLVLPDFTYLRENADRVEACVAHARARGPRRRARLPAARHLVPDLRLGAVARAGPQPHRRSRDARPHRADPGRRRRAPRIGPFDCQFIPVTHSVPHGFAIAFHTPQGTIMHTGDFKLDLTPVDGRRTDLALLGRASPTSAGVRLLLSDSTNAEGPGHAPSERRRRGDAGAVRATTTTGASSSPASPRTSIASSRSSTPRSPAAARSRSSAGR